MIIYKNYVITPNENGGYVLSNKKINQKNGEEYLSNICYPATLKQAFERILKIDFDSIIDKGEYTIKEALDILNEMNENMRRFMSENVKEEF